ncbi:MAG: apolipoprotein N-acyltransferase [Candidatus Omnitrophota bacterium]
MLRKVMSFKARACHCRLGRQDHVSRPRPLALVHRQYMPPISQAKPVFFLSLSSALLALGFSSFNFPYLVWVGLVPLFFAIEGVSFKKAFVFSYLSGLLFFMMSMYWLARVTVVGWISLSLYQGIYFGFFGIFCRLILKAKRKAAASCAAFLAASAMWVLLEYVRAGLFGGIGWNLLAYSQYRQLPLIQIADITGAYGVSFLIVLANFCVFSVSRIILLHRDTGKGPFFSFRTMEIKTAGASLCLVILSMIAVIFFYGYPRLISFEADDTGKELIRISLIQANINQTQKWDIKYKEHILRRYESLTMEAKETSPDMIIWPETAIPGYLNKEARLMLYAGEVARRSNARLLLGAPMAGIDDKKGLVELNSAVLYSEYGQILQRYDKLRLVMFGEFIPFEKYLGGLRAILPVTGNFISGSEHTLFNPRDTGRPVFACLICFEDIFPDLARRSAFSGADFMVNITNDAWFGRTSAAYQHAANSVFRAVENRRPFARCANTGLTCFIKSSGRIYRQVDVNSQAIFVEGFITDEIGLSPCPGLTFYTKYGDIFILSCLLIIGCFMIDYTRYRKYNK